MWFKDWKRGGADEDTGVPEHESITEGAVGTQPRVFSGITGEAQNEEAPELQVFIETAVLSTPQTSTVEGRAAWDNPGQVRRGAP